MASRRKAREPIQIISGQWYIHAWGGEPFVEECCDCGLTHVLSYRLRSGKLEVQYKVDNKRTAAIRRKLGIKVTRGTSKSD